MFHDYPFVPTIPAKDREARLWAGLPLESGQEKPPPPEPEFVVGLDLGQQSDFSALCIVQRDQPDDGEPSYAVRHLHRWPLGTPYLTIAADVAALAYRPELRMPRIAADMTGCGRPVMEQIGVELDKAKGDRPAIDLVGIVITSGHSESIVSYAERHVAKSVLVSVLQAILPRLAVAKELPHSATLVAELKSFRVKITASRNETFESWRERDHDDLVLAVALALWLSDRAPRGRLWVWT
jgi:hypothetical protein